MRLMRIQSREPLSVRRCRDLKRIYERYLDENPRAGQSGVVQIEKTDNLEKLVDLIAMHITMSSEKRQEVLECQDLRETL